ncbi:MAG: arginine--tRNA ligase [Candidatus Nomurabacteria bacterium]|nr:arginine--tRNA ligase [Candidatus Nomurabacteria bacterium]
MKQIIENLIRQALKNLDIGEVNFIVEHPEDFKNGDYSTNVAMVCAKQLKMNPKALAEKISAEIFSAKESQISKIEVAGAGFINFYLSREFFSNSVKEVLEKGADYGKNNSLTGKKVMVEYTQPNPFKPFHIGHLMSNSIGESISRIVEFSGAKTVRANYQGDVGPHVAKAIYGMYKAGPPANESTASVSVLAQYIGQCYSQGSNFYDTDEQAKKEIDEINKKVYNRSDEKINQIYDWGRKVTLEAFEELYKILGTKFDYYFFESEMAPIGEKIVRANIPKVFEESDGAIVFHAEKYNPKLHTRVFLTSHGIPLYETKEIGLTTTKFEKENPDISIVTTAIEQGEYMKVVQQAIALMHPELESRMKHITHGMMRLASGKMSSRKGNVVTGESLLRDSMDVVLEKIKDREFTDEEKKKVSESVGVAALKYSILRSSLGSDIIYDFEKSISFEGDSGPYLQYSAMRAKSILAKALNHTSFNEIPEQVSDLEKILYRFPEVVAHSYAELEPHHIATYLTSLASSFNSFYTNTQILNTEDKYSHYYVALTKAFLSTMQNGLWLLGITLPERM